MGAAFTGSATRGVDDLRSITPHNSARGTVRAPGSRAVTVETRERWRINPDYSTMTFTVKDQTPGGLKGKFQCWGGILLLDHGDLRRSAIRLWVDLSSFDTGSAKDDDRVAATELFDAGAEPALVFDGEWIHVKHAGQGVVIGRLAVHCVDREAAVSIEGQAPRCDARGVWHLVFNARASIDTRSLRWRATRTRSSGPTNLGWGDAVEIVAHVEAARDTTAYAIGPHQG